MKATSSLQSNPYRHISVTLDIPIPESLDTTPQQVQALFKRYILENPHFIRQILDSKKERKATKNHTTFRLTLQQIQALQDLENLKPKKICQNSTELLRKIRDEQITA